MRKSPRKHIVREHLRNHLRNQKIKSYIRGSGEDVKLAKPTISVPKEDPNLTELFYLQNKLIEHKYPITGIWEHIITHAGDVFRGLCRGRSNSAYIMEKVGRLKRFMERPLSIGDFREFKYYSEGGWYEDHKDEEGIEKYTKENMDKAKAKYMDNLARVKLATEHVEMDSKRKEAMLNALNLITELTEYYEGERRTAPYIAFSDLEDSVEAYLEE